MSTRLEPKTRETQLLKAAIILAKRIGYANITRDAIALEAGVASGLVSYRLGNMASIRTAVMRQAVRDGVIEIIAQGLAAGDEQAKKAPPEMRTRAAQYLMRGK
jgi:AcrR family transcriptional regulator